MTEREAGVGKVSAAISFQSVQRVARKSAAAAANNLCLLNLFKFNQTRSILWKVQGGGEWRQAGCVGGCELTRRGVVAEEAAWHNLAVTARAGGAGRCGTGMLFVQFMCNALPMLLFLLSAQPRPQPPWA